MNQYVKAIIVGHSSDDDDKSVQLFMRNGADFFELKPTNFKRMKIFLEKNIDRKDILDISI